ncbi:hypothetical protein N865_13475 [Intrasporangium oryzae NRRL B-24470]|uniref:GerMN domain-containing protein n=1 Tax=Intrasporangium oryzae NRRL B-24470 TaxID=1386089 RepID=W9G3X2_9MICO|nr:LpqB family beta-propeller domain-containing protein [Intrasporangium oryzae]EWT00851.1 hypothetical protein N865_13475 [Intrasporangium oryzae NRRL B-24470]
MRWRAAVVAALAALTLGACQGLPGSGPVVEGRRLGEPINEPAPLVGAQGPVDGASEEAIVRGFIRAGEDSDETRQAGKSFLAPQSVDLWQWTLHDVVVYDGDGNVTLRRLGPESIEVTAVAVATVSPDGRYRELPAGTKVRTTFGLTKVGGQWRIELPASGFGLWLDTNAFDRLYTNRFIYYVTPAGRTLVPDSRWFPNGSRFATTLARAQLGPVPDYLAGAVVTGVPSNTKLAVNAVPIDGGTAQVNLSARARDADPDDRTAMWAQLTATLSQLPSVTSVALAAEGTSLDLPGGDSSASSASALGFDVEPSRVFAYALRRRGDTLTAMDPRELPDSSGPKRQTIGAAQQPFATRIPQGWVRLALSTDSTVIAAVGGDFKELSLWRGTAPIVLVPSFATSLTRPTFDSSGYLWVGGADSSGAHHVFVLDTGQGAVRRVPKALATPWLKDRRIVSLALAPDGARILMVTTNRQGGDVQLGLSGIVRAPNGEPIALAAPLRQADPLTFISDVLWLSGTTYAVLGRVDPAEAVRPWVGTIGGGLDGIRRRGNSDPEDSRLASVADASSLTTIDGARGLVVLTSGGRVLVRAGATWRKTDEATDLLVPGR